MPKPFRVVLLLVSVVMSVDLAVVMLRPTSFSFAPEMLFLALALGQFGVLAVWLALGGWPVVLRLVLLLVVIGLCSRLLERPLGSIASGWLACLLVYAAVIGACLLPLRVRGACLVHDGQGRLLRRGSEHVGGRWRFSLWNLLEWMTCVAIVLGVGRLADFTGIGSYVIIFIIFCGGSALVTLTSYWSSFRGKNVLVWLGIPAPVCPAAGVALGVAQGYERYIDMSSAVYIYILVAFIQAAFVSLSVAVLRLGGYRLAMPGDADQPAKVDSP